MQIYPDNAQLDNNYPLDLHIFFYIRMDYLIYKHSVNILIRELDTNKNKKEG